MILCMMATSATTGFAQSVTYNHDASKQNQITVMETGSGSLTPELYYTLLHSSYRKSAAEKNKLGYRTLAGINLYNQLGDEERIDSALTARAEVEALNVADRQTDFAWLAESGKVSRQLDKLKANINHIIPTGGTVNDKHRWEGCTICTGVPSPPPRMPICRTPNARRNTCASTPTFPHRTRLC